MRLAAPPSELQALHALLEEAARQERLAERLERAARSAPPPSKSAALPHPPSPPAAAPPSIAGTIASFAPPGAPHASIYWTACGAVAVLLAIVHAICSRARKATPRKPAAALTQRATRPPPPPLPAGVDGELVLELVAGSSRGILSTRLLPRLCRRWAPEALAERARRRRERERIAFVRAPPAPLALDGSAGSVLPVTLRVAVDSRGGGRAPAAPDVL